MKDFSDFFLKATTTKSLKIDPNDFFGKTHIFLAFGPKESRNEPKMSFFSDIKNHCMELF